MFILLVHIAFMTASSMTSHTITTAEFSNKESCEVAAAFYKAKEANYAGNRTTVTVTCVSK